MSKSRPSLPARKPLSSVCTVILGQSPPGSSYNTEGNGVPFFQGKTEFTGLYAEPVKYTTSPTKIAERDDVLISVRAPVGPTNLCPAQACIGRGLAAIRPPAGSPPKYWMYATQAIEQELKQQATGSTFEAITGKVLRGQPYPVFEVEDQHEIVSYLDTQFSRLTDAEASLRRAKTNLERYRRSILHAACTGRLVPTEAELARREGRDYERADEFLKRILVERRRAWEEAEMKKARAKGKDLTGDAWKKRYKEPVEPDGQRLPELPEGWCWASVDQLTINQMYGTSSKCSDSGEIPILRMGNIIDGAIDWANLKYLPRTHDRLKELILSNGDVLFNRTNSPELVGKAAVYRSDIEASFASYLIRIRLNEHVLPETLVNFLNGPLGRKWVKGVVAQQVGQANVNGTKLKNLAIPLPPRGDQNRIVAITTNLLDGVKRMELESKNEIERISILRQSILQSVFSPPTCLQEPPTEAPA